MLNQINISNNNVQNEHIPTNNTTITKEPSETTVTTNNNFKTTAFKEGVGNFHACVLVNCSDIKKNRTVNILTHNMKEKAAWSNFKQVLKNIGRNIGVLARKITGCGGKEIDAIRSETYLEENLKAMHAMMNDLKETDFKDFFKFLCDNNLTDYVSVLRNCEKELEKLGIEDKGLLQKCKVHLDAIRTKTNEMRDFIIEETDKEPLKQLMNETAKLLETGTKETYEQALQNLDKIKEHENFIKGYNALITDANKDCLPENAKPLLYGNRSEYGKIIEDIEKVRTTGFLKDLHAPNYFYSNPKYEDPIRDALCSFGYKAYEDRKNLLKAHTLTEIGTLPANGENKGKSTDIGDINAFSVYTLKIDDPDFVDKYRRLKIILDDARRNLEKAEISDTGDKNKELTIWEQMLWDLETDYQVKYHINPETGESTIRDK